MTAELVTLDLAKQHLQLTHDQQDEVVELLIAAASELIIEYLKDAAYEFTDTSGERLEDSSGLVAIPARVQLATLTLIAIGFAHRGEDGGSMAQFTASSLPPQVTAYVSMMRTPTLA